MITEFQDGFITKSKLNEMVDGINWSNDKIAPYPKVMEANETIYVGAGQTYTTLNSAIDYCKNFTSKVYIIDIIIKTGTILSEQINIVKCDLSHVKISSEDVMVSVNSNSFISLDSEDGIYKQFIMGVHSNLPLINTKFKNIGSSLTIGIKLSHSSIYFTDGKGCFSFGYGLKITRNSYASGKSCFFEDTTHSGIHASAFSTIDMSDVSCERNGSYGLYLNNSKAIVTNIRARSTDIGIITIGNSEVNMSGGLVDSSSYAISCHSSKVSAMYSNLTGVTFGVLVSEGGIVNAQGTSCTYSQTANTITANGIIFK